MECNMLFRRARALRYVLLLAMLALAVVNAWLWWHGSGAYRAGWVSVYGEWPADAQGPAWMQLLVTSLTSMLLLGGLYRLLRLMRLFEGGEFFSVAATRHLRGFALSLISVVAMNVLGPPALMLVRRLAGWTDVGAVSLRLDSSDLWTLLVGAVFFLVTSLMVEARRLEEDNERII